MVDVGIVGACIICGFKRIISLWGDVYLWLKLGYSGGFGVGYVFLAVDRLHPLFSV